MDDLSKNKNILLDLYLVIFQIYTHDLFWFLKMNSLVNQARV